MLALQKRSKNNSHSIAFQGANLSMEMSRCETDIRKSCQDFWSPENETAVSNCFGHYKWLEAGTTRCQNFETTDCDCYSELVDVKEEFKRKCFARGSAGLFTLFYTLWIKPSLTYLKIT